MVQHLFRIKGQLISKHEADKKGIIPMVISNAETFVKIKDAMERYTHSKEGHPSSKIITEENGKFTIEGCCSEFNMDAFLNDIKSTKNDQL